ncbi:MAG: N-6 DNA methylase [Verrucomicrobia bacterium]|nr:N-6 DNA methylase [Verrucomicrobiota bacterium]
MIPLRRPTSIPAQIQYLDLLPTAEMPQEILLPQAVAEFQGRAVVYFLDGDRQSYPRQQIEALQQRLANRGDHAVLAVALPGNLTLYPINLDIAELQDGRWETVSAVSADAPYLFQGLACGTKLLEGSTTKADPVFAEIHRLMLRASRALAGKEGEGPLDGLTVLSMTGRALFFRFLIDRNIVRKEDVADICPAIKDGDLRGVFSNAERAAQTSVWLDETFNGDLLPLMDEITRGTPSRERKRLYLRAYAEAGEKTVDDVFNHLEAILKGYDAISAGHVQLTFPGAVDWDDLNFRHIPVGVLSQVYESFSHEWDSDTARTDSVHYTPRNLAKLLVDQALAGLDEPHRARVLDPSCGAGVFLVLAFRELVRRRWEHDGKRPGTGMIHQVLYKQLCGFDISESALRLSALGLYITAIELNEIIRPPSALHVPEPLKNLVLFNHGARNPTEKHTGFILGSLSDDVSKEFDGAFDVVVGNPPWTRLKRKGEDEEAKEANRKHNALIDKQFTKIGARVLKAAGLDEESRNYDSPGGVPDIPFIWRAKEWVRPGGIIGLALDARLILTQSGPGKIARDSVFKAMTVTGILNGSDLSQTDVWANHNMPWILFWALNENPAGTDYDFHFLTPVREDTLCQKCLFRLDHQSAFTVTARSVIERGWLLKALAMGTILDVQVQDTLEAEIAIQSQWLLDLPVFQRPEEKLPLDGLDAAVTFEDFYGDREPHRSLSREAYRHPMLLIPIGQGEGRSAIKSYRVLDKDYCFPKKFLGYSAADHADPQLSVALLHLLIHSSLFLHFCFIRSKEYGAGRRIIYKEDVDAFPFPRIETISPENRKKALRLADEIDRRTATDWDAVDRFVCKLFCIPPDDAEVIRDTIEFAAPYQATRNRAMTPPDHRDLLAFATKMQISLQPFFNVVAQQVRVSVVPKVDGDWNPPWRFVTIMLDGEVFEPKPSFISKIMRVAAETSASRVVVPVPNGGIVLGLLNQRRFWTRSRARLCALHISRDHLEKNFPLPSRQ